MDEQMAPPMEGAAAPADEASGALGELVNNVGQGLSMIADLVAKTQDAPPEAGQMAAGLLQGFQDLIGMMSGGGAQGGAQPMQAEMQANANSGARAMPPGMG